jgi:hypothetical protein
MERNSICEENACKEERRVTKHSLLFWKTHAVNSKWISGSRYNLTNSQYGSVMLAVNHGNHVKLFLYIGAQAVPLTSGSQREDCKQTASE